MTDQYKHLFTKEGDELLNKAYDNFENKILNEAYDKFEKEKDLFAKTSVHTSGKSASSVDQKELIDIDQILADLENEQKRRNKHHFF